MTQLELLSYPASPGWKAEGTSRSAAEAIKPRAKTLRDQVLAILKRGDFTADEVAAILRKSILSVRPRISELRVMSAVEDTGRTRKNASGIKAIVWRAIINPVNSTAANADFKQRGE